MNLHSTHLIGHCNLCCCSVHTRGMTCYTRLDYLMFNYLMFTECHGLT
jgi:hypothetical protein